MIGGSSDAELPFQYSLNPILMHPKWRGRQKHSGRRVRTVFNPFRLAKHPYEPFHAIVVRRELLVAYRPIDTHTGSAIGAKIVWPVTKRHATVVIGSATQHA